MKFNFDSFIIYDLNFIVIIKSFFICWTAVVDGIRNGLYIHSIWMEDNFGVTHGLQAGE